MAKITYLGHSAFLVENAGKKVMFDPWISKNPVCPRKLDNLEKADVYVVSHSHGDHGLEDAIRMASEKGGKVVGIYELANYAAEKGAEAVGANIGGAFEVDGVSVRLTHALHSSDLGAPTGSIVRIGDLVAYHAGDTDVFYDMKLIGELYKPDVALLPIGGHFTMGPLEAAKAVELLKVGRVIPMHYGTFPVLYGTPDMLREELSNRGIEADVLEIKPGESLEV